MNKKKGFTLVEILIVVVILGILAAIVIPQFTEASTEAKESRLASDLQMLRSQIELYKVQHNDLLPGQTERGGSIEADDFVSALTTKGEDNYGPYLQKFPRNPFVEGEAAAQVTIGTGDPSGDYGTGWYFDTATGKIYAGDAAHQDL